MNLTLVKKNLLESRLLFASLGTLLFAVCWLRVFIVTRLQTSQFATIIEQFWDDFKDFWPVSLEQLLSYTGRIAVGYNEPLVVFGVCLFAIARGSDVVSGELGRGTLEMLLAQPVSRLQVLYTHAMVTLVCLAVLCGLTWAGTAAGIHTMDIKEDVRPPSISIPGWGVSIPLSFKKPETIRVPMSEKTKASYFIVAAFNLFCLGAALAGFSSLLSSLDRYRWRTIGIVVAAFAVSLLLKLLGQAISEVAWLQYLSLFTPYEPQKFVDMAVHRPEMVWSASWFKSVDSRPPAYELGALGYNVILLAVALISYVAAGIVFQRRDLPAPL